MGNPVRGGRVGRQRDNHHAHAGPGCGTAHLLGPAHEHPLEGAQVLLSVYGGAGLWRELLWFRGTRPARSEWMKTGSRPGQDGGGDPADPASLRSRPASTGGSGTPPYQAEPDVEVRDVLLTCSVRLAHRVGLAAPPSVRSICGVGVHAPVAGRIARLSDGTCSAPRLPAQGSTTTARPLCARA